MMTDGGRFEVFDPATGREADLAMEGLWLTGRVLPVGARLIVVHTFRSAEKQPIEVVYAFGLPRDASLRRFKVVGEGFQIRSDLKPIGDAQKEYEQGIKEGHLATLARTYRDGRVNLSVGNIRPNELIKVYLELVAGVDLRDDGLRFRFPFTLAPCYHAKARAVAVRPGVGELELPAEEFGDVLLPQYLTETSTLHAVGFELAVDACGPIEELGSPSHAIRIGNTGEGKARVTLHAERDVPDRDLVLDVRRREPRTLVCGGLWGKRKARFTVVMPSRSFGTVQAKPKSVVFVLDRSGSMGGTVLDQAKRAVEACLGALFEQDHFGLIAFDDTVEAFHPRGGSRALELAPGTMANREAASRFLASVQARGGTELGSALDAAANLVAKTGGDLLVVTDGQVAGTEGMLARLQSQKTRAHVLGIGAASKDRFFALLARQTGGTCRFLTPQERIDQAALELFAGVSGTVAREVTADLASLPGARLVVKPAAEVFDGHPLVVMGEAGASATGSLSIRFTAQGEQSIPVPLALGESPDAETVALLQGARLITDLEAELDGEWAADRKAERREKRLQTKLEELGREYGLANRALALVAVIERPGDDASQVPATRVVPVGMPRGVKFESYFSGGSMNQFVGMAESSFYRKVLQQRVIEPRDVKLCAMESERGETERCYRRLDPILSWAARLAPDGGLPGPDLRTRLVKSAQVLLALLLRSMRDGTQAFQPHIHKVVTFLEAHRGDSEFAVLQEPLERVVKLARGGGASAATCLMVFAGLQATQHGVAPQEYCSLNFDIEQTLLLLVHEADIAALDPAEREQLRACAQSLQAEAFWNRVHGWLTPANPPAPPAG